MSKKSPDRFKELQRRLADEVQLGGELLDELSYKRKGLIRKLAWRYVGKSRAWQIQVRLRKRPEGILITSKPQDPLGLDFYLFGHLVTKKIVRLRRAD